MHFSGSMQIHNEKDLWIIWCYFAHIFSVMKTGFLYNYIDGYIMKILGKTNYLKSIKDEKSAKNVSEYFYFIPYFYQNSGNSLRHYLGILYIVLGSINIHQEQLEHSSHRPTFPHNLRNICRL
jgi:hypothetical protein